MRGFHSPKKAMLVFFSIGFTVKPRAKENPPPNNKLLKPAPVYRLKSSRLMVLTSTIPVISKAVEEALILASPHSPLSGFVDIPKALLMVEWWYEKPTCAWAVAAKLRTRSIRQILFIMDMSNNYWNPFAGTGLEKSIKKPPEKEVFNILWVAIIC